MLPTSTSFPAISLRSLTVSASLIGLIAWVFFQAIGGAASHQEIASDSAANAGHAVIKTNRTREHVSISQTRPFEEHLPPRVQQSLTTWRDFVASKFAGDQACATCHRAEYDAHQRSGHSRTLILMPQSDLASELSQLKSYSDPRRNQEFAFDATEDQFIVRDEANAPGVSVPVTWLLGSGMHAQTPIAVDEHTQTGVELRWSSFPSQEKIGVTPGHERFDDFQRGTIECFGRPLDGANIRACLGCHSTVTSPPSLPILQSLVIANVGCERCHGPRQDHVSLAHQGFAEEAKPMMRYETAESYMDTCAACHRDETSVRADAKPHELARFQPYGIKRSQCYLETPGNLTCSTCHDPHDTVSSDRSESIEQCLQCHGDNSHADLRASHKTVAVCTHDPGGDCIECHMPSVAWAEGISFHDHWIRIP